MSGHKHPVQEFVSVRVCACRNNVVEVCQGCFADGVTGTTLGSTILHSAIIPLQHPHILSSLLSLQFHRIYLGMFSCENSSESLSLVLLESTAKHFQNLSVSSELVLATVCPSGLRAMWRILWSWPERSATRVREGAPVPLGESGLQMERWLCGWPWEERSSRWCEDHRRPLIYRRKI